MNRYDPNIANLLIRLKAWVRALFWRYRRPLLATAAAAAALGVRANSQPLTALPAISFHCHGFHPCPGPATPNFRRR